jgi:hypothetical protein
MLLKEVTHGRAGLVASKPPNPAIEAARRDTVVIPCVAVSQTLLAGLLHGGLWVWAVIDDR